MGRGDWYAWCADAPDAGAAVLCPTAPAPAAAPGAGVAHICRLRPRREGGAPPGRPGRPRPVVVAPGGSPGVLVPSAGFRSFRGVADALGAAAVLDSCPALWPELPASLTVAGLRTAWMQVCALQGLLAPAGAGGDDEAAHRAAVAAEWANACFSAWVAVELRGVAARLGGEWVAALAPAPGIAPVVAERRARMRTLELARAAEGQGPTAAAGAGADAAVRGGGQLPWQRALVERVVAGAAAAVASFVGLADDVGCDADATAADVQGDAADGATAYARAAAHGDAILRGAAALAHALSALAEAWLALEMRRTRAARALAHEPGDLALLEVSLAAAACTLERLAVAVEFALARHSPALDGAQRRAFCRRLHRGLLALSWDCTPSH